MAVNLSPIWGAGAQLFDNSGNVLSGGKIYTYAAGTTTPATTYTSFSGITANSNPIILNSAGRVPFEIWLTDGVSYKFVLKDSNDTLIATYDNLIGINSNFIAYTAQQEIQTATAGQTVFNLTTMQYQPATNNLSVFVDGVNQYGPGAQYAYVETDSDTVTFVSGLHVGASVKFTTATPVSSSSTDAENVSYNPPFTGSVGTNVEAKLAQTISVEDFGAVGDGVTDDTTYITNAEDYAQSIGAVLYFPSGKNYTFSGSLTLRCSISGYGATITQLSGANENSPVFYISADDLVIQGITIDGDLKSAGVFNNPVGYSNITIKDCVAQNCLRFGIGLIGVTDGLIDSCRSTNIQYVTAGTGAADGFYIGGCTRTSVTNSFADDFRRIGFVSEENGTTNSNYIRFENCTANNANNCDDSSTEYNAGFWAENTNDVVFESCVATNIASGIGQSSGRVYGMVANGIGNDRYCSSVVSNCTIGDAASNALPSAIVVTGSTTEYANVYLTNTTVVNYNKGFNIIGVTNTVNIANCSAVDGVYASSSDGAVTVDGTGGGNNEIVIDNLSEVNPTFTSADAGTFNLYAQFSIGFRAVTIKNCYNMTFVSRQTILKLFVSDSTILKRSPNYGCFSATNLWVNNCRLVYVAGSSTSLMLTGFAGSGCVGQIENTYFENLTFETGQTDVTGMFNNCYFSNSAIRWGGAGTTRSNLKITNSIFNVIPTGGSVIASISNGTKDTLLVQGCSFYATDIAQLPVKASTYQPDLVLLHSNNYNTTTFTDVVGGTVNSQVNNIQTL